VIIVIKSTLSLALKVHDNTAITTYTHAVIFDLGLNHLRQPGCGPTMQRA